MSSNFFELIFLSAVQGITEFLPISSSAHLIITDSLYTSKISSLILDTGMHLGSLMAILVFFRSEIINIFSDKQLLKLMVFGSMPLILIGGVLYQTGIINYFRNIETIAWTTLIFAILLFFADKLPQIKNLEKNLNLKLILIIGTFQILALVPGVSRAGIVITAARILNFDRYNSIKISFFLSIPAISGASFLALKDIGSDPFDFDLTVILGIIFSFIFSYLTIKYFLVFVKKFSLNIFVLYRIILSIFLFSIIYL